MLIKKMLIENFRQYEGKQEIIFSTDKEKNVTLFLGDNGAGKTVISQAFIWCFYGDAPAFSKKESLLSKGVEDGMYDGWERPVNVTIEMEHSKNKYEISRTGKYLKENGKVKARDVSFSIAKTVNGERKFLRGKELENCFKEILPRELAQYFFLSGEKIDSMSADIKSGKPKDFANAVNTLLDLDYYKDAIKHLRNISKEYDVSTVSGMEEELKSLTSDIKNNITNREKIIEGLKDLEKSIETTNEEIIYYQTQLKSMKSSRDIEIQIEREEDKLKRAEDDIKLTLNRGLKLFSEKMPFAFLEEKIKEMDEALEQVSEMQSDKIPERLHADLIDWIEKNGKCICGNEVEKDGKAYNLLEKLRHVVPPESIGVIAKQMSIKAADKSALGRGLKEDLQDCKQRINQLRDDEDEFNDKIKELNEELSGAEDTTHIQKALAQAREDLKEANAEKNKCDGLLAQINLRLDNAKREREDLISSSKEGKKQIAWKQMAESLLKSFEEQIQKEENEKRNLLIKSVKDAFKNIYGNSFSINIDENYRISTNTDLEKSTGQGMAVIFSFLAGLLDVIKKDKGRTEAGDAEHIELESYPLVLDAPFSALDKQRITSICKVLPKVSEQIIIFIKDTDGSIAKEEMKGKIGKSYMLVKKGDADIQTVIEEE